VIALEAQLPVGVVLEDEGVELMGQLDQLLAAPHGHRGPGGILEVVDGVDELAPRALAAQQLELLSRHPVTSPSASTGTSSTRAPCRRMVLSVPEKVGASLRMASPTSTKAEKASDSACPEPLEMMRLSGAIFSPSKSPYL
jgi:hypothetical protein